MSFKRKLEDFLPQQGIANYHYQNYPHSSFDSLQQISSFNEGHDGSFDDSWKRRRCWEVENGNFSKPSHFSVSSTSAFQSTHNAHRTSTTSTAMNIFAVSQTSHYSNFNRGRSLGNDEGDTDQDNTPASINSQHSVFASQFMYQQQLSSCGLAMDIEDIDFELQNTAMQDDEYDTHSSKRVTWFDRIRQNRTNRTAENVLVTDRHCVIPSDDKGKNSSRSHLDSSNRESQQDPSASCKYCLRSVVSGNPTTSTITAASSSEQAGGYLSCHYCDRMCCANTCLRPCELCHGLFCGVCSTTDYMSAYERYLCLECHHQSN
jgi:hypothetical protein